MTISLVTDPGFAQQVNGRPYVFGFPLIFMTYRLEMDGATVRF